MLQLPRLAGEAVACPAPTPEFLRNVLAEKTAELQITESFFLQHETSACFRRAMVDGCLPGCVRARSDSLQRHYRSGRRPFHAQQWRLWEEVATRNDGSWLRLHRLRQ